MGGLRRTGRGRAVAGLALPDEIVVAAAEFGALSRCHVLEPEMREIGLAQFLLVSRGHGRTSSSSGENAVSSLRQKA